MRRLMAVLSLGLLLVPFQNSHALQTTFEFDVTAVLPQATGFECILNKADATGVFITNNTSGSQGGNIDIDFGNLEEAGNGQTLYGWYKPQGFAYYVCDLKPVEGVGIPSITFTYNNTLNPNAVAGPPYPQTGLDTRGTLTVVKTILNNNNQCPPPSPTCDQIIGAQPLGNASAINVAPANIYGGWGRFYLGLGFIPDPLNPTGPQPVVGSEPFTSLDHYGEYSGILTATLTW